MSHGVICGPGGSIPLSSPESIGVEQSLSAVTRREHFELIHVEGILAHGISIYVLNHFIIVLLELPRIVHRVLQQFGFQGRFRHFTQEVVVFRRHLVNNYITILF